MCYIEEELDLHILEHLHEGQQFPPPLELGRFARYPRRNKCARLCITMRIFTVGDSSVIPHQRTRTALFQTRSLLLRPSTVENFDHGKPADHRYLKSANLLHPARYCSLLASVTWLSFSAC